MFYISQSDKMLIGATLIAAQTVIFAAGFVSGFLYEKLRKKK